MLYDAKGFEKIYIKPGLTDMRKGVDGLKLIIGRDLKINPFQTNVLFLFCGRNSSKIKGLVWEGDGFLMLYKRIEDGHFVWPKSEKDVLDLTQEQFELLMKGFSIEGKIRAMTPKRIF